MLMGAVKKRVFMRHSQPAERWLHSCIEPMTVSKHAITLWVKVFLIKLSIWKCIIAGTHPWYLVVATFRILVDADAMLIVVDPRRCRRSPMCSGVLKRLCHRAGSFLFHWVSLCKCSNDARNLISWFHLCTLPHVSGPALVRHTTQVTGKSNCTNATSTRVIHCFYENSRGARGIKCGIRETIASRNSIAVSCCASRPMPTTPIFEFLWTVKGMLNL